MRILAIDYGTVRVGLALTYGSLAEPLEVLPNDDHLLTRIKRICMENEVRTIVVGLSERKMAEKTKAWVKTLIEAINLPVELADETLSSREAAAYRQDRTRAEQKRPLDHWAAAIFLQHYLDSQPMAE